MNIKEVLKEENVGMEYKIRERIYKVEKSFTGLLALKNVESYGYIESEMHIFDIVNGEFEEVMDWSKVPVDTKVLVSDDGKEWSRRHFAKYEDGKVYCFNDGYTSFTIADYAYLSNATPWEYCKLYQE